MKRDTSPDISRWVAESRAAQGLPPKVTDPAVLGRVVVLLRAHAETKGGRR